MLLKQDINPPGAESNCACYTMNNINYNLKSHELQFCEWHPHKVSLSPLIKDLKKALLSEVETGSLVGELTCGEESIAA